MSNDRKDEIISVRVADKEKCPCAKCKWGVLFGGWNESWCVKFIDNKPGSILYDNEDCPHFAPRQK